MHVPRPHKWAICWITSIHFRDNFPVCWQAVSAAFASPRTPPNAMYIVRPRAAAAQNLISIMVDKRMIDAYLFRLMTGRIWFKMISIITLWRVCEMNNWATDDNPKEHWNRWNHIEEKGLNCIGLWSQEVTLPSCVFMPIVIKTAKSFILCKNSSIQTTKLIPRPPGKLSLNAHVIAILNNVGIIEKI